MYSIYDLLEEQENLVYQMARVKWMKKHLQSKGKVEKEDDVRRN